MTLANRGSSSIAVASAGFAVLAVASLRLLGRVASVGNLLVIELLRVGILGGGVFLAAWLALHRRDECGHRTLVLRPGLGRSVVAGVIAGPILGLVGFEVAAIPEPTDTLSDPLMRLFFLAVGGLFLGTVLGLIGGLFFAAYTHLALRRAFEGEDEGGLEGVVRLTSVLVGNLGIVSAVVHALSAEFDLFGGAMLVVAAAGLAFSGRRAAGATFAAALPAIGVLAYARNAAPPAWDETPSILRGPRVTSLASNDGAFCGLRAADHRLVCWGSRAGAILGTKNLAYRTPQAHPTLGVIRAFAIAEGRACAVVDSGDHRAVCWTDKDRTPRPVGPPDVVEVAIGRELTVALTAGGEVFRWDGGGGEPVSDLREIAHVTTSESQVVARGRDESLHVWLEGRWQPRGGNWRIYGAIAHGTGQNQLLDHPETIRQLARSGGELCALSLEGAVTCTRSDKASPNVVLSQDIVEIAGSSDGYCARTDRELWCWHGFSMLWSIFQ